MKAASATGSLVVLSIFCFWSQTLVAQHHPAPAHHPAGAPAQTPHAGANVVNHGMAQPTAAQQKQMQQQMQAMMKEEMRQQEEMLKMHQQMYEQHMHKFHEWAQAHGMGGGGNGLPNSPAAMQQWLNTQKHNKGLKKSYDPAYDEYLAFQRGAHTKAHSNTAAPHSKVAPQTHHNHTTNPALVSNGVSVSLLRTVHMRLQAADRDYDGHRMRAVHHVGSALQHLGSSATVGTGIGSNTGAGAMAQSESDHILRDALMKLRTAHNHMSARTGTTQTGTTGGTMNYGEARGSISAAIHELDMALSVR